MWTYIISFLDSHIAFTVTFFGCLLGTILTYAAPRFTRDHLIADEWFSLGNLGISSFIHENWAHFIGNMMFALPSILFCEKYYGDKLILIFILLYAFLEGMFTLIIKQCWCGFSAQACALIMMMCSYGLHWWGISLAIIIATVELAMTIGDKSRTSHLSHFIGMAVGFGLGLLLQKVFL